MHAEEPFVLRSGRTSTWYVDARQVTFDGAGAVATAEAVLEVLSPRAVALGGMTMGADPIAIASALIGTLRDRPLSAFSIRKEAKDHGTGGRLVGPVEYGDRVTLLDDTVTTGSALFEALEVARSEGLVVVQAICLVDRSEGAVSARMAEWQIPYAPLVDGTQLESA